jgi:hypothetical protein
MPAVRWFRRLPPRGSAKADVERKNHTGKQRLLSGLSNSKLRSAVAAILTHSRIGLLVLVDVGKARHDGRRRKRSATAAKEIVTLLHDRNGASSGQNAVD